VVADPVRSRKRQRFEVKYIITETQAAAIRRSCAAHLPPDPYSSGHPEGQYPIVSTYLDSSTRELLRGTIERRVNRFKLRVRTYRSYREPVADHVVFFEIKRKTHGVVHKTRARTSSDFAAPLLWNGCAFIEQGSACDAATRANVNEFLQLRTRLRATPVVGVYYTREAYEADSVNRVRITLDRNLHYGLLAPPGNGQREMWWPVGPGTVILEVKFTGTYPFWVSDMLHRVEVLRRGVCKYLICSRAADGLGRRA
jgi:hypothetical protein